MHRSSAEPNVRSKNLIPTRTKYSQNSKTSNLLELSGLKYFTNINERFMRMILNGRSNFYPQNKERISVSYHMYYHTCSIAYDDFFPFTFSSACGDNDGQVVLHCSKKPKKIVKPSKLLCV